MKLVRTTAETCPHDGAPAEVVDRPPEGTRIGDYEIVRLLGEGGMGFVFEVRHQVLNRRAAMKFLRAELTTNTNMVTRFLQEAKTVNVINHDHIIDIYDYGEGDDGVVYFVMEFLEGEPLTDLLERRGRLPLDMTVKIFTQMMRALSAAHKNKVVHRDLKPDNVFLVARENDATFVKLLDFGIARFRGEGAAEGLTREGMLMGTPQFMSPEQATGQKVDVRSDVFSVGVMLYCALVGRLPFDGDGLAALLANIMIEDPTPPREAAPEANIPASMERMILRALSKKPEDRYQTIDDMLVDMSAVKSEAGIIDEAPTVNEGQVPTSLRQISVPPTEIPGALAPAASAMHAPTTVDAPVPTSRGPLIALGGIAVAAIIGLGVFFAIRSGGDSGQSTAANVATETGQGDPAAETTALAALVQAGDLEAAQERARADVEGYLRDGDAGLQSEVVDALALVGSPRLAPLLYDALNGSPPVRLAAARALRDLGIPDAAPKIRAVMGDAGHKMRVDLAACLVPLGDKEGLAILRDALAGDPGQQLTAAVALAEAGEADDARPALTEVFSSTPAGRPRWARAARGLVLLGDEAAKAALAEELARPEPERALAAAEILAAAGDEAALGYLDRVVADPGFAARGQAALALAKHGDKAALRYVSKALEGKDERGRILAAAIAARLAEQGGDDHAAQIASLADDAKRRVQVAARVSLLAF